MFAVLDLDMFTEQWACVVLHTPDDAGMDSPAPESLFEHVRPAMRFQLARPGGPGPFIATMPEAA